MERGRGHVPGVGPFNCWGHVPSLRKPVYPMNYPLELSQGIKRVILFTLPNTSCTVFKCHTVVPDISTWYIYIANYFCQGFDVWRTCSWRWRVILKSCDMMNSLWMNRWRTNYTTVCLKSSLYLLQGTRSMHEHTLVKHQASSVKHQWSS